MPYDERALNNMNILRGFSSSMFILRVNRLYSPISIVHAPAFDSQGVISKVIFPSVCLLNAKKSFFCQILSKTTFFFTDLLIFIDIICTSC